MSSVLFSKPKVILVKLSIGQHTIKRFTKANAQSNHCCIGQKACALEGREGQSQEAKWPPAIFK